MSQSKGKTMDDGCFLVKAVRVVVWINKKKEGFPVEFWQFENGSQMSTYSGTPVFRGKIGSAYHIVEATPRKVRVFSIGELRQLIAQSKREYGVSTDSTELEIFLGLI